MKQYKIPLSQIVLFWSTSWTLKSELYQPLVMGFPNGVKQRSFFSLIFSQNNKVDILGSGISKVQSSFIFPGLLLISLVLILKLSTVESSRRQGCREIIFQPSHINLNFRFSLSSPILPLPQSESEGTLYSCIWKP